MIRPVVLQQEIVGIDKAWTLLHYYFFRLCLESQDIIWNLIVKFFLFVIIWTNNKIRETNTFRLRLSRSCRHKFLWGRGYESVAECVSFNPNLSRPSQSITIYPDLSQFVSGCLNFFQSILIYLKLYQIIWIYLHSSQYVPFY